MVPSNTSRQNGQRPLLRLQGVCKSYGRQQVFRDLNLDLKAGQSLGLVGPNGAGKTTLLRLIVGLISPDSGAVELAGQPPPTGLESCPVAYFAGEATLPPASNARTWARLLSCSNHGGAANKPIRKLSRGSRQRLGLEVTLGRTDTRLVILDEPWEGLDPDASRWLRDKIRHLGQAGIGTILSSHRMHDLAGTCDCYAFLVAGQLTLLHREELAPGRNVTGDDLFDMFDHLRKTP